MNLLGDACSVRDSRRRAALDSAYAAEHPIQPAKEGKDPIERLKEPAEKPARAGRRRKDGSAAPTLTLVPSRAILKSRFLQLSGSSTTRMTHDGRCPACDAEGAVGAACPSAECVGKDLHFIPSEYAKKLRLRGVVFRDPNLGRSVGDFLLVDILGRGTYGRVYLALQAPLWMKAALKLLTYDHDDPEVKRDVRSKFEREAVSLSKLAHPNIVRLIKYGFWAEQPFLVMEYVDRARTLKLELDEQDYVSNPQAVVDLLVDEKALLQRPLLVSEGRAIIGRPKDRVGDFLDA